MNAITRFVRAFATVESSGHSATEKERIGVRNAPPAATNPEASFDPVTLRRRHFIAAAFGAAAVVFGAVALPVAFVSATLAPIGAAPKQLRAAAAPSDSAVPQHPGTSACDCEA